MKTIQALSTFVIVIFTAVYAAFSQTPTPTPDDKKQAAETAVQMFSVAAQIIYALAPAFAAGFAIQRLLEIADNWLSLFPKFKLGSDKKVAILSFSSVVIGTLIAWRMGFAIIHELDKAAQMFIGPNDASRNSLWLYGLDYMLSGLIISAGTEGLNSIVKFLGYAKEVKKEQVNTEAATANATAWERKWMSSGFFRNMSAFVSAPNNLEPWEVTQDPRKDVEDCLKFEMQTKEPWKKGFAATIWKKKLFSLYPTPFPAVDAPILIYHATQRVALGYSKSLTPDQVADLQAGVGPDSKPEDHFDDMSAMVEDAPFIP